MREPPRRSLLPMGLLLAAMSVAAVGCAASEKAQYARHLGSRIEPGDASVRPPFVFAAASATAAAPTDVLP